MRRRACGEHPLLPLGKRVRTTGAGGACIVRALSAWTADVLRDLVEELSEAAG
jgi:hypothetical protein